MFINSFASLQALLEHVDYILLYAFGVQLSHNNTVIQIPFFILWFKIKLLIQNLSFVFYLSYSEFYTRIFITFQPKLPTQTQVQVRDTVWYSKSSVDNKGESIWDFDLLLFTSRNGSYFAIRHIKTKTIKNTVFWYTERFLELLTFCQGTSDKEDQVSFSLILFVGEFLLGSIYQHTVD